jgi:hypothetical protein
MGKCTIKSKKQRNEYHVKFAYYLDDIRFKPLNVLCIQLVGTYISKQMNILHECISYLIWR